ncbi:MAG: DUF177 domain-containing protein [Candidatus Zixiibacteriota bacterium]|nr:MAG: DUF177 domain-containing protein [candidate division Zixibacteria bacterium]
MILDLRELDDFPAAVSLKAEAGEFRPFAEEVTEVNEVTLELAIQKSGEEYFCQGEVKARYLVECSRCLAPFELSVIQATDFVVCGLDQKAQMEEGVDDEDYVFLKGGDLRADLTEPVRQALVLSASMKPLCSEACQGLCPSCGTNLNDESCDCKKETIDPRWEALKHLKGGDE